jgi:probable F420-dependent oxidoreductase
MRVDAGIGDSLEDAAPLAAGAEKEGYDGAWAVERIHDPFLRLLLAGDATQQMEIGTGVAVAFARSPMTMAISARDLNDRMGGRLLLGLGSQVKAHIERRFSMPWSHPAARMREYIAAMRAIWSSWQEGTKLDFRGDYYTHTLMTPMFSQKPSPYGDPRVVIAGIGDAMMTVAATAADGLWVHPFSTASYIEHLTIPTVDAGLKSVGRDRTTFQIMVPVFVASGENDAAVGYAANACRKQLAFYGSTPSYRRVLDHHGWGDLQTELTPLSKEGKWNAMGELIDDTILQTFAVVGAPEEIGPEIARRYGELADRVIFYMPYRSDPALAAQIMRDIKALTS